MSKTNNRSVNRRNFFRVSALGGLGISIAPKFVSKTIIEQLDNAGIARKDILIWDRREFQLHETAYTEDNYPGIKITGTERKDESDSFSGFKS